MSKFKHFIMLFCSLLLIIFNFNAVKCLAAPAVPTAINIEQPNGAAFEANLHGDEWSNWTTETSADNIIVEDSDNYWKYARISYGKLVPSESRVGLDPVPQDTLKSDEWVNILSNFSEKSEIPKTYYASGDTPQSTVPIQPAGSPQKILVLLVSFTDISIQNTDSAWYNNFFGDTGKSVKTYYQENSQGSFYFSPASESYGTANDGIIRVTLNYAHPNTGATTGDANRNIVKNALIAADPYINYASYDTNGNGYIDASELHIVTIVAGYERSCGAVTPNVWGHRWALFGTVAPPQLDGKYVAASGYGGYTQQGEIHAAGGNHMATIGILCHELGHDLGLFDEYDTVTGAYVVGVSSVMDGGSWGAASSNYVGSSPTNMDPYSKIYLGFANPLVVTSGQQAMNAVASGGYNIVKVPTQNANQYFLIENRNLTSFDIGLQYGGITNGGIAIWHINEDSISAYKFADTVNNSGHDPGVWLEKTGTPWDPYYRNGGVMDLFADTTNPNSKLYDGSSTNIKIKSLDPTGTPARIQIGDATGIGFLTAAYSVNENAGSITLTVTRTSTTGALTVDYTSSNGTATAGADYTVTSGTLSFADGEASKTITVPILDDAVYEGNESFTVTLSNPSSGTIGTATATVTIVDNDTQPAAISISPTSYVLSEGAGNAVINILRTGNITSAITVDYTTSDGTAVNGSDYTATSGTLTFASGETSKSIIIPIIDDTAVENDENFTVKLSNPSMGSIVADTANVTIVDNDSNSSILKLSASRDTIFEGNTYIMYVYRTGDTSGSLKVDYKTSDGTATAGSDYTPVSGSITFADGESKKYVYIFTNRDNTYEVDEDFTFSLSNPSSGVIDTEFASCKLEIQDYNFIFDQNSYTVNENGGNITVTVNLVTGGYDVEFSDLTIYYTTANGTATAGSDYTATTGSIHFGWGELSKTITIPIINDTVAENTETFSIKFTGSSDSYVTPLLTDTATITIIDDDKSQITLDRDSYTAPENSGYSVVTIVRTGSTAGITSVNYSTSDGTALAGVDYTATNGTITFAAGESSKNISIPIIDDSIYEGDKSFSVLLSNPSSGSLGITSADVKITEDEPAIGFKVGVWFSVVEHAGNSSSNIPIYRTGDISKAVTVDYYMTDITAASGKDYVNKSGSVTFQPGENKQYVPVTILDDVLMEDYEYFAIKLCNPSSGIINKSEVDIRIDDNDIAFRPLNYTVSENNSSVILTVSRTFPGAYSVQYTTKDGTATAGSDYTAVSGVLNFGINDTTKTISIPIQNDLLSEGTETFSVILSNPSSGGIENDTATVTIVDDDTSTALIDFNPATYTIAENSGSVTVTVTRSEVTTGTVTVDYTTVDGTAAANSDYTATSGTLTFNDGETTKNITIPVLDDNIYEGNETFTVKLSNPSTGNINTPTATVNITDNEAAPVISFNPINYTIQEDGVSVTMAVYRTGNTTGPVSVNYNTVNGTAISGSDYTGQSGALTFADGETYKPIVISIKDDTIFESSETFNVILSNPVGGILGSDSTAMVTITDNDTSGGTPAGLITTAKPYVSNGTLGKCGVGQTQQLTIIATFENGVSMDITALATWSSEYTSVATVDKGLITGVAKGMTKLSFTYNGQSFSFLYTIK